MSIPENTSAQTYEWWQKSTIYHIYPRSFKDTNDDGTGDLPGIIEKLEYLEWLGIDCIWISPVYPSPMHDFGYDISDYTDIHPLFGSMDDFRKLLKTAHLKGIKVIMDLVPNHTSIEHPWFLESRSSRESRKRSWYIWKDPGTDGKLPNNWISEFGGPAWEFDQRTQQYYYHTFLKEQPDLNWYNPEVQDAMWNVIRFWFDLGIDGFRIDVLWYLVKDKLFRDNPPNPEWEEGMPEHDRLIDAFSNDQPYVHELVQKMREIADNEYDQKVLIGEIYLPFHKLVAYYNEGNGVHLPFNFSLIFTPWKAEYIFSTIAEYEGALSEENWPNWVLGNHDKPRLKSRIGADQERNAAILLLTLRGTPTLYYGDEIGMEDGFIPQERLCDPRAILEPDINVGRDPQRIPMQWDAHEFAGFSRVEPWLPVGENYPINNVQRQQQDEQSLLWLYRKLINLRKKEPALHVGAYIPVGINNEVIVYLRKYQDTRFMIVLNLGNTPEEFIPGFEFSGTVEIATGLQQEGATVSGRLLLQENEGLVIRLK